MRRKILMISALLIFATAAFAERPVWIIGHGANYLGSALAALNEGADGVEIDVRAKASYARNHWSVTHSQYWTKDECDKGTGKSYVYSLKNYLSQSFMQDKRMRVLWIDVKDEEYIEELVQHVHDCTPNGTPYSIIYNCYKAKKIAPHAKWLRDNLRNNEGINMGSLDIPDVEPLIGDGKIPKEKHYYTIGYYRSSMKNKNQVIEARKMRDDQNKFCSRVGFWTCDWEREVRICIDSKYAGKETNFDLILAYFPEGLIPVPGLSKTVLPGAVKNFINNPAVNGGRWRKPRDDDKFWPTE